ncbi:unnamed protein product [Rotaria socialis]
MSTCLSLILPKLGSTCASIPPELPPIIRENHIGEDRVFQKVHQGDLGWAMALTEFEEMNPQQFLHFLGHLVHLASTRHKDLIAEQLFLLSDRSDTSY